MTMATMNDDRLVYEDLGDGYYRLLEPVYWTDSSGVRQTVPAGFVTDLASVPRLPFIYLLFADRATKAAIVHDWLYSIAHPREKADKVFHDLMKRREVSWFIRIPMYVGVRLFGWHAYGKHKSRKSQQR